MKLHITILSEVFLTVSALVDVLLVSFISFVIMAWALYLAIYTNKTVPGWTSNIVSTVFLSGIQLIVLGIIGEYLGKLFIENKRRPNYIIEEMSLKVQGSKFQVQGLKYDNQKPGTWNEKLETLNLKPETQMRKEYKH